jgi:uncharacterized protein YhaN
MEDKVLIAKIKELKKVQPNKEWLVFCRENLQKEAFFAAKEPISDKISVFQYLFARPALVGIATFVLALGSGLAVVKAAQGSLPGDRLFPVKLALERAELGITFDQAAKTKLQGEITGKRADELTEVAKLPFSLNERKMAQAIDQIEQQIADTQKELPELKDKIKAGASQEEIAAAMKSMQENTAKLKMAIEQAKKISEISENKALSSKISDISDKLDKAHSEISEIIDTLEETRGDAQKQEQDENSTTAPRVVP